MVYGVRWIWPDQELDRFTYDRISHHDISIDRIYFGALKSPTVEQKKNADFTVNLSWCAA